ncbi:hypothetical protein ACVNF4_19045 [Streptomyces sp. S6]
MLPFRYYGAYSGMTGRMPSSAPASWKSRVRLLTGAELGERVAGGAWL